MLVMHTLQSWFSSITISGLTLHQFTTDKSSKALAVLFINYKSSVFYAQSFYTLYNIIFIVIKI